MTKGKTWQQVLVFGVALVGIVICAEALAAPVEEEEQTQQRETMFSLIKKGGPVMIPLGLGSVIAVGLAMERLISLRRDRVIPPAFLDTLMDEWKKDRTGKEAVRFCEETSGPVGNIFRAGILRVPKGEEAVEKAIEDAGYREADKLKRSLKGLSVIATVSPLLGLLGTVYGMIAAFQTASSVGMGKADVLAKGIYEALVTTATGLTIAIPVLLVFQFLSTKVDAIVDDLDEMTLEFLGAAVFYEKSAAVKLQVPAAKVKGATS